jgi:hypothetical protein
MCGVSDSSIHPYPQSEDQPHLTPNRSKIALGQVKSSVNSPNNRPAVSWHPDCCYNFGKEGIHRFVREVIVKSIEKCLPCGCLLFSTGFHREHSFDVPIFTRFHSPLTFSRPNLVTGFTDIPSHHRFDDAEHRLGSCSRGDRLAACETQGNRLAKSS